MNDNKLWKIIDKEFISYYGGYAYLISNCDCKFHIWERKEDVQKVCDKLNGLHEEKEILEVQLRSANNEIDKLMAEINMLTDTCHDCCKEIRGENEQLKQLLKSINGSFTFDDNYVSWFEDCVIVSKEGLKEISLGSDVE